MTKNSCTKDEKIREIENFIKEYQNKIIKIEKKQIAFESKVIEQLNNVISLLNERKDDHVKIVLLEQKILDNRAECLARDKRIDEFLLDLKETKKSLNNLMMKVAGISGIIGVIINNIMN